MYKTFIALFVALMMLTACYNDDTDKSNTDVVDNNEPEVLENVPQEQQEAEIDVETEVEEPSSQDVWSSLPEYDTLMKQVDSQNYTFETVTDNEEKRILLLMNDKGEKEYKSIFIKHDNYLKIIHINDSNEGQIFNEVIGS